MYKLNYKKIAAIIVSLFIMFFIFLPFFSVFAADPPIDGSKVTTIHNPLGSDNMQVKDLLLKIMNLVAIVGGVVVVFMIIYSGYKIVMAQGNPGELEKAKDMFLATIIGGAVLLGADVIANVVVNTVKTTTGAK